MTAAGVALQLRRHGFAAALALGTLGSLWLRTGFPPQIIAAARFDDALFVRLGRFLLLGQWLGPFDNLTLVKGAGYPAFLALAFGLGIPLKIAESLVYLAAAAGAAVMVRRWSRSDAIGAALFLLLAFNPVLFSNDLARVIREGLYIGLTLGAVLLALLLVFARPVRRGVRVITVAASGLVWAWFWLTREEGVWLIPSLLLVASLGLWSARRHGRALAAPLRSLAAAVGVALALVAAVSTVNLARYGTFGTVEVKSSAFERAYGALYRVKPAHWQRYVVFPADVRRKVYAVSPAARELAPAFEGENGAMWRRVGCEQLALSTCPEILAGWFQWALRDGVAMAGHYRTAADATAYYTRLADEVDAACATGRLDCVAPRKTLAPPFAAHYVIDALARLPALAQVYWSQALLVQRPLPSVVTPGEATTDANWVLKMADFVGGAQPTREQAADARQASAVRTKAIFIVAHLGSLAYRLVLLLLVAASLPGLFFLWRGARSAADDALLAFALSSYVGVICRALMLCYLDVTAIPSVNVLYASPASPLLVTGAVVGAAGWLPRWRKVRA